ncbi:hypothetical protein Bhyg_04029 [Pseudolycoriella hygida]|uniref:Uncharacterized protein n=1 Tax=Pseudolycoriella hygida TaxID=35572 RepID=A0A9Q0NEF5_9DIPT|nr:hypothetical protein Bhyg_04029 [Pseudolycoriella hygida]
MEALDSWKLNINNFYPVGLKHYGNDKTSLVLIWSSNLLCTKKFRSFTNAIERNLPPDKDQVRQIDDIISNVITNTLESVILTEDSTLKYFETPKVLRNVDYVTRIKAICTSKQGFVILHLNDDGDIQIILHPDSFPCPPERLRYFDISFDKSYCQTTWNEAQFNIVTLQPDPDRPAFFNALRKCPGEQYVPSDTFIFFSINNTLLSLVEEANDYGYHQVHTHSSIIRGIHASKDLNSIYVLLESGVVDVIYSCEILGVTKTSSLYFMHDVGAYDLCDDIFVYSDGFQVFMGRIEYSTTTRTFGSSQKSIPLPGIVAFTIVKASKTAICLSENKMFYKIRYSNEESESIQSEKVVMLPVSEFLEKAENTTVDIQRLVDCYDSIRIELLTQHKMFEALALRYNYRNEKSVLRFPFTSKVKIYRTAPDLPATAIYPTNLGVSDTGCYLHIQIQPHRYGKVFSSNIWCLNVHYETASQNFSTSYRLVNEDFSEPLDLLIKLENRNHIIPPRVDICLRTSVQVGEDVICLTFPVHTDVIDFTKAMKLSNKIRPNNPTIHRNCKLNFNDRQQLTYQINLSKPISLNEILRSVDSQFEFKGNECFVSFFNNYLELTVDETLTKICLKSLDAATMFHVKKVIFERLRLDCNLAEDHCHKYAEVIVLSS